MTLFACIICRSTEIAVLTDTLFGCPTFAVFCLKHGQHWLRRSEQCAIEARKQAAQ